MGALASIAGFAAGNWQRIAIYALLATVLLGSAAGWGYMRGVERLYDYQAKQAQASVKVILKQGAVTEKVVTRYIRMKEAAQVVVRTVKEEVTRYEPSNPGYCLDAGWRSLHDAAATGTVPDPARRADETSGAPKAAEALGAVTDNYAACRRTADQLESLQEWVRQQATVK